MPDALDDALQQYFERFGTSDECTSALAELLVAVLMHCPEVVYSGDEVSVASAAAALRRRAAVSRSDIARLAGMDEVDLSQWETGVARSPGIVARLTEVVRTLMQTASESLAVSSSVPKPTRPSTAFGRLSIDGERRDPLLSAIRMAQIRGQFSDKHRALSARKCNWYRHISHEAHKALHRYLQMQGLTAIPIPVPVDLIAEIAVGLSYYLAHLGAGDSGWFDPGPRLICINADEPKTRQRYTFGHELGHAVMHGDKLADAIHRDNAATIDEERVELTLDALAALTANEMIAVRADEKKMRQIANRETEANVFAASLIMPAKPLCDRIQSGVSDIQILAREFGVSVPAMEWRLRFLDACLGMPEAVPESKGQGAFDYGD